MASSDKAIELAAEVGQSLPLRYLNFLNELPARPTLGEEYGPILEFGGRRWRPHTREELAEPVQYNGGKAVPRAHETMAIAEQLRDGDAKYNGEMSSVLLDRGFTLERLCRGFCIGDDGNGEPLFVDSQTGKVFTYYHDGMDVAPFAGSLIELVDGSRDWTCDEDSEPDVPANS